MARFPWFFPRRISASSNQEAEELDEKKLAEALQQAKKKQILGRGFYWKMGKIDEHLGVF